MDTRIAQDEAAANLLGAIVGGVVRNDDLKIRVGLRQSRLQGVLQIVVPVVHRHGDAYPRLLTAHFPALHVLPIIRDIDWQTSTNGGRSLDNLIPSPASVCGSRTLRHVCRAPGTRHPEVS